MVKGLICTILCLTSALHSPNIYESSHQAEQNFGHAITVVLQEVIKILGLLQKKQLNGSPYL